MKDHGNVGFRRIVNATRFSLAGLNAAWQHEAAFRQECVLVAALTAAAFWVGDTALEITVLIASAWLMLIVELVNSAVEAIVDRVGAERHELSGRAKDLGSAAVFLSLLLAAIVWGLLLWEKLAATRL